METSRTLRMLAATAVVSALAILVTSPAQARWVNEGDGVSVAAPSVGNPGDGAWISPEAATAGQTVGNPGDGAQAPPQIEEAVVTSSVSDGFDRGTFIVLAGGAVLVLGAGALLFTARNRRIALP